MLKNITIFILVGTLIGSWTPTVIDRLYQPPVRYEANVIQAKQDIIRDEDVELEVAQEAVEPEPVIDTMEAEAESGEVAVESSSFAEAINLMIYEEVKVEEPTVDEAVESTNEIFIDIETETEAEDKLVVFEITQAQHYRNFSVFANKPIDIKQTTFTVKEPDLELTSDYTSVEPYNQTSFRCAHDKSCLAYNGTAQEETYVYRLFDGGVELLGQPLEVKIKLVSFDGSTWESDWLTYTLNDADERLHYKLPDEKIVQYYLDTDQEDKVTEYIPPYQL